MTPQPFIPALIVVDVQEDFFPPHGPLGVFDAQAILPTVNRLLSFPFPVKLATKDWHPPDHISFASNHTSAAPFTSSITILHPDSSDDRTYTTTLWPDHCIQGTPGAELVPELDTSKLHYVIEKGQDPRVEMYSAFTDPFHSGQQPWSAESTSVCTSALPKKLKESGVTDVFVVGLALDYCVKATAEDAVRFGYRTHVVREATRAVGAEQAAAKSEKEMAENGVNVVGMEGVEVGWVKALGER